MFGTRKHRWKQLSVGYIDLNDEEFSFVFLLKSRSAAPVEKDLLHKEATRRKLDEHTMTVLVKEREYKSNNYGCWRCNTVKPYEDHTCVICGYRKENTEPRRYVAVLQFVLDILCAMLEAS